MRRPSEDLGGGEESQRRGHSEAGKTEQQRAAEKPTGRGSEPSVQAPLRGGGVDQCGGEFETSSKTLERGEGVPLMGLH